jgi:hypothetical protein
MLIILIARMVGVCVVVCSACTGDEVTPLERQHNNKDMIKIFGIASPDEVSAD